MRCLSQPRAWAHLRVMVYYYVQCSILCIVPNNNDFGLKIIRRRLLFCICLARVYVRANTSRYIIIVQAPVAHVWNIKFGCERFASHERLHLTLHSVTVILRTNTIYLLQYYILCFYVLKITLLIFYVYIIHMYINIIVVRILYKYNIIYAYVYLHWVLNKICKYSIYCMTHDS